jgi:5-formaminoimidazole-4-carboxamide-1-(beta)-D-ribofuranosyl 5'-monophosphate synthetase
MERKTTRNFPEISRKWNEDAKHLNSTQIQKITSSYGNVTVGVLGSHSALDVCTGARAQGLANLVICQKGRDSVYSKHYHKRKAGKMQLGCVDDVMLLNKFKDIANGKTVAALQKRNVIFIPHRSFSVYVGYDAIENDFAVPIFGNRALLRAEERTEPKNQHWLLQQAGIWTPKVFPSPSQIDRVAIVKASEAKRKYERAFFLCSSPAEYEAESKKLIKAGILSPDALTSAKIEEFVMGTQFNFNFFASPLTGELELLGTDFRRQTNLDGLLRLPAPHQPAALSKIPLRNIEVGHVACTIRESLLEEVFAVGEKFAAAVKRHYAPGLIGPFALQGALSPTDEGEKISIFDVSFRVPGSPGIVFTPYSGYLHGRQISTGERIAMELKEAKKEKRLDEVVT